MSFFAITAVGQDRPGIVSEFTGVLFRQGANLEDTTMTRLRDQFAMVLVVDVPDEELVALETALHVVATQLGLSVVVRPLAPETAEEEAGEQYLLRVYGADHPGIVHAVTAALAQRRYNITDLDTRIIPGSGGPVYVMLLEVQAPPGAELSELLPELQRLAGELGVELSCEPLESEAL